MFRSFYNGKKFSGNAGNIFINFMHRLLVNRVGQDL